MKTLKNYLAYFAVLALLLTGCSKEETAAGLDPVNSDELIQVSFATALNDILNNSRAHLLSDLPECSDATPMMASVVVRPEGGAGDGSDDISVDVAIKGDAVSGYFTAYTDDLKLPAGHHTLMSFLVYADEAMTDLIWLAPVDDGPGPGTLSEYVDHPLPMEFDLYNGEKYYLDVEVLCFDERNVNEYGYLFFDLIPEVVYNFCFFANYCGENGRDYPASYTLDLWYGTDATLANNTWILTESNMIGYYDEDGNVVDGPTDRPFAEPLCIAIPGPQAGDEQGPYLTYRLTLNEWSDAYTIEAGGETSVVGTLSWADVLDYIDPDGNQIFDENIEYLHERINCDEDDTCAGDRDGDGCANNDDDDGDGIPDINDRCPDTAPGTTVDAEGCPTQTGGCDDFDGDTICDNEDPDIDNDGILNAADQCDYTVLGAIIDANGCSICDDPSYAYLNGETGFVSVTPTSYPLELLNQTEVGNILISTTGSGDIEVNVGLSAPTSYAIIGYTINISQDGGDPVYSESMMTDPVGNFGPILFDVPDVFDENSFYAEVEVILCPGTN